MSKAMAHRGHATAVDLAALPPDTRAEVVAGEVVDKASPSFEHGDAQGALVGRLLFGDEPEEGRGTRLRVRDELVGHIRVALGGGVAAAAVIDRAGRAVVSGGALGEHDLAAITGTVSRGLRGAKLLGPLLQGQVTTFDLDHRAVLVAVAARCLFVVVVHEDRAGPGAIVTREVLERLRAGCDAVVQRMRRVRGSGPLDGGEGGSSPESDELELIEIGVTRGVPSGGGRTG